MNGTKLYRAIGELDSKWIELAEQKERVIPRRKMILIGVAAALVLAAVLSIFPYGKRPMYPAVPGNAELYISSTDCIFVPGYTVQSEIKPMIGALGTKVDDSYHSPESRTVTFHGKTYQSTYRMSFSPGYRRISYDAYNYKDTETGEMGEFYFTRDENAKLIGYQIYASVKSLGKTRAKSQNELTEIARSALGEFTDAEYYANVRVSNGPYSTYEVEFYNMIGDIELADSSFVRLDAEGKALEVKAMPEPDILKAMNFSDLDSKEFDAVLEAQVKDAYVDYHRDDEEILADVKYSGLNIQARMLSLDDDGEPVVLYLAWPQLAYEYTLRGEAAEIAAERGLDIHESGTYAPPAYASVEIKAKK